LACAAKSLSNHIYHVNYGELMAASIRVTHDYIHSQSASSMYSNLAGLVADFLQAPATDEEVQLLPFGLANILRLIILDSEIQNGGLQQYFANIWDDRKEESHLLIDGLRSIGAHDMESVMRMALEEFDKYYVKIISLSGGLPNSFLSPSVQDEIEMLDSELESTFLEYEEEVSGLWDKTAVAIYEHARSHEDEYVFCYPSDTAEHPG